MPRSLDRPAPGQAEFPRRSRCSCAHAPNLKSRAALSIAYGCGLRVSEIANLKVGNVGSARMLIRVEQVEVVLSVWRGRSLRVRRTQPGSGSPRWRQPLDLGLLPLLREN